MVTKPTSMKSALAEPAAAFEYAPSGDTLAALDKLNIALQRRAKLDSAVDAASHEIVLLETAVNAKRSALTDLQAEAALESNTKNEVARLQEFDRKRAEFGLLMQELQLARDRLVSLEGRAPAIDAEIQAAAADLNREVNADGFRFQQQISGELEAALAPLRAVIDRARGLSAAGYHGFFGDFLGTVRLFDPVGVVNYALGPQGHDLLGADCNEAPPPVADSLQIVQKAQAAVRRHRAFVPLHARPKPYVIKGSNFPGDHAAPPLPQPAPPPPMKQTFEKALRQPYSVKSDSSGARSRGSDGGIGGQIMQRWASEDAL
jgi:hypothetical protein